MPSLDSDELLLDADGDLLNGELSASNSRENSVVILSGSIASVASCTDCQKSQDIQNLNKRKQG